MPKYLTEMTPTTEKQRFIILDSLRGIDLFIIILANFPEFGLWTFLSPVQQDSFATSDFDRCLRFFHYMLIDGKGYGLFSILFGCGFSIILSHSNDRNTNGTALFYRRMLLLLAISMIHLLFLWSGDILCLYAVLGMILPLFQKMSNKALLIWAIGLLFLPVLIDLIQETGGFSISAPLYKLWWDTANSYGINEDNFAMWLHDATDYKPMFQFLMQGAVERMWEFIDGDRLPKVMGLFILGFYIGRNKVYARLMQLRKPITNICLYTAVIGIPASAAFAWHSTSGHPLGETFHSLIYFVSVLPMTIFYASAICLIWCGHQNNFMLAAFAKPGRMALTNYIMQSVFGIIIYYGIGLGLGGFSSLASIELIAVFVFFLQLGLSTLWMNYFKFGPLEWIWRMLTYGKYIPMLKQQQ